MFYILTKVSMVLGSLSYSMSNTFDFRYKRVMVRNALFRRRVERVQISQDFRDNYKNALTMW